MVLPRDGRCFPEGHHLDNLSSSGPKAPFCCLHPLGAWKARGAGAAFRVQIPVWVTLVALSFLVLLTACGSDAPMGTPQGEQTGPTAPLPDHPTRGPRLRPPRQPKGARAKPGTAPPISTPGTPESPGGVATRPAPSPEPRPPGAVETPSP